MEAKFNHFDEAGNAVMVDVTGKEPTFRAAVAEFGLDQSAELIHNIDNCEPLIDPASPRCQAGSPFPRTGKIAAGGSFREL